MLLKEYNEAEAMELFKNDGRIEQRDADARGMYAEGLMPDVIARIQNIPGAVIFIGYFSNCTHSLAFSSCFA